MMLVVVVAEVAIDSHEEEQIDEDRQHHGRLRTRGASKWHGYGWAQVTLHVLRTLEHLLENVKTRNYAQKKSGKKRRYPGFSA